MTQERRPQGPSRLNQSPPVTPVMGSGPLPRSPRCRCRFHCSSRLRRVRGIHAYRSAEKNGEWLTMSEAATTLGVTHRIRRLIKDGILPAEQVVPGAPYQIRASDLQHERVTAAVGRTGRPCRAVPKTNLQCLQTLDEGGYNERLIASGRMARSAVRGLADIGERDWKPLISHCRGSRTRVSPVVSRATRSQENWRHDVSRSL
jgi:excisionase family DNA binding protein